MFIEETAEQYFADLIKGWNLAGVKHVGRTGATYLIPSNVSDISKILPFVGIGLYNESWVKEDSESGEAQTLSYDMTVFTVVSSRFSQTNHRDTANAIAREIKYRLRGHLYRADDGTRGIVRFRGREYVVDPEFPELLVVQQSFTIQYHDSND